MSQALYRRYRPETFAEVIGQEHVTGPLTVALAKNRVNHAYLFSGPRGCGKTTSARILARCLNCAEGPTATPCGVCESCRDLARGGPGSLDVVEIDAASHGGVDDARSLRERAAFAPARDRFKVFVIDEAHMVSTQGFNALLKIVEEPPPHVRFVFATTEPDKVIGTIRSRTHHYPFRLVPPQRLESYLAELCEREGVPVGQGVLPLVVRAGGGSVRDSLSVLDQLIGGAGEEGLSYGLAVSLLGYTDSTLLDEVIDALAAGDGAGLFGVVDRVISSGHDPRRFVEDLLERLRDLVVVAAVPDGGHAVLRALPGDQLERMRGQAARFGRAALSRAADVVNAALTEMTGATSPRLQLELLCARLLLPEADDSERGLRARLDRLERRLEIGVAASVGAGTPAGVDRPPASGPSAQPADRVPADQGTSTAAQATGGMGIPPASSPSSRRPAGESSGHAGDPVAQSVGTSGGAAFGSDHAGRASARDSAGSGGTGSGGVGRLDVATIRRRWPEAMAALASRKRTTWSLVSQYAQVLDYDGERLLLGFDSDGRAVSFGRGPHAEVLRLVLIEVLGLDCRFEAVESGGGASARRPSAPSGPGPSGPGPSGSGPPSSVPSSSRPPEPGHRGASSSARSAGRGPSGPAPSGAPGSAGGVAAPGLGGGEQAGGRSAASVASDDAWPAPARPAPGLTGSAPGLAAPAGPGPGDRGKDPVKGQGTGRDRDRRGLRNRPARAVGSPYADVPPPDEPLPDDEPPLDEPPPDAWGPTTITRPEQAARSATEPGQMTADSRAGVGAGRQAPAEVDLRDGAGRPAGLADGRRSWPGPTPTAGAGPAGPAAGAGPAGPAAGAGATRGPGPGRGSLPSRLDDDEPSPEDPDLEGANLVGAPVVEQILGGQLIEELEA